MKAQLHRCYKCKKVRRTEGFEAVFCCGTLTPWNWIDGRVNGTKCDIRCTSANGHKCNCQCGGKNHAADWSHLGRPMNEVMAA